MKSLIITTITITLLFLALNVAHAKQEHNTPRPTPRVTGTPYATPTSSPIPQETISPTASPTETPVPSPTVDPSTEPTQSPTVLIIRTDLSDGRSDGKTDSLDCLNRDCSGNKTSAPQGAVLPATGEDKWIGIVVIGLVLFTAGVILVRTAKGLEEDAEGQQKMGE